MLSLGLSEYEGGKADGRLHSPNEMMAFARVWMRWEARGCSLQKSAVPPRQGRRHDRTGEKFEAHKWGGFNAGLQAVPESQSIRLVERIFTAR